MTQQPQKKLSPLATLKSRMKAQKRKPLGTPIEWTDEDLDSLSTISPADLKAAEALWNAEAPAKVKQLLDAQVEEEK